MYYSNIYDSKSQELFDELLGQTDNLPKITPLINTSASLPIELPSRRYSSVQQTVIIDFCDAYEGTIIRKNKGPWATPLMLTPK